MIHWISVEDRVPEVFSENGEEYYPWILLHTPYGMNTYQVGYYRPGRGWFNDRDYEVPMEIRWWAEIQEP